MNAPLLFNVYIDTVVRAFQPLICHLGVKWSYKIDGNIRECRKPDASNLSWIFMYADDIALVSESEKDLQEALRIIDETFIQWGMEISVRKTQVMRLASTASEAPQDGVDDRVVFHLRGQALEEFDKFKYLGSICSADMSMQPEIANRLSRASGAYHKLKRLKIWGDRDISHRIKLTLYKVIVQSTLLYGCETWAIPDADVKKLEIFQMRCLRRLCGISLMDKISNFRIRAMCKVPQIADLLRYRRLRWLGHVARMERTRMPLQMMFSTIAGNGARGRPLKKWNDYVREDLDAIGHAYDWWKKCKDREEWRNIIQVLLDVPSP